MVGANNDETRFHPSSDTNRNPMSDKVSEMAMSSLSSYKSANGSDQYYTSGWDPLVSLSQNQTFAGSSMASHHPEFASSHIVRYPSGSSFGELVPKLPCFGNGGFSEMVGSFGQSQDDHQLSEGVSVDASPDGKRRKRNLEPDSSFDPNKNGEGELQRDLSGESTEVPREPDEKKQKTEQSNGANLRGKQAGKQSKDNSNSGDGGKNDYIHVRARRGQATNSHSLAERVRREKISERMRLLQELVPGCNKITGKAVMLDEIINYVQSLQQQVEFLSMKLATVNPESNIDLERILPKDILGFGPGMGSSQPYPHGVFPGPMQGLPSSALHFPPLPQSALDTELHNLFQMGFNPGSTIDNLGQNGRLKSEL